MDDLQATIEISVDLGHFHNVDMFQRGFYQISVDFVDPTPVRSNLEVHLLKDNNLIGFSPAKVNEQGAVSKIIQVLHKRQQVPLDHTFLFRCHRLVDSRDIFSCISSMKFQLDLKLLYCPKDNESELSGENFEIVSNRQIFLHVEPINGLHEYTLVLFEYGFMAGVEVTVHASLVALHQPLISTLSSYGNGSSDNLESTTLESILFRKPLRYPIKSIEDQMVEATKIHDQIINLLLALYSNFKCYFTKILQQITQKSKFAFEFQNAMKKIEAMPSSLQGLDSKEDFLNQANMNLASACSYVLAFWSHILDTVCLNKKVLKHLSYLYHKKRVQRFQSSFFTLENPRYFYQEGQMSLYNSIAASVRSSGYYQSLPSLKLESIENDGVYDAIPIVFEDKFLVDCKQEPIFIQKYSGASTTKSLHIAASLETVGSLKVSNVSHLHKTSLSCKSSPKQSSLTLSQGGTSSSEPKNLIKSSTDPLFTSSRQQYSEEIYSYTLEEPDDFPNFNIKYFENGNSSNKPAASTTQIVGMGSNSTVPSYKTNASNKHVFNAFGVEYNQNITHATLTSTLLSPIDEPEPDCGLLAQITGEVFEDISNTAKPLLSQPHETKRSDNKPEKLLTIESFLKEEFEESELRDEVCEPASTSAPQFLKNLAIETFNSPNTLCESGIDEQGKFGISAFSKQLLKHAAEKSKLLGQLQFPGHVYCDLPFCIPICPYLLSWKLQLNRYDAYDTSSHLIILVHGLNGSSNDLRMVKTYLQLGLQPILRMLGKSDLSVSYLLSVANEVDTYDDIEMMTGKLIDEILHHVNNNYISKKEPTRISFIGHSLGGLLIRSAISHDRLCHLRPRFHTFLSFSSPHLGTIFNTSALVNTGMWLIQKWKKSKCLQQLSCKEEGNMRKTFIYQLSKKPGLEFFTNVLLLASAEDKYVPYQSARIEMCRAAAKDKSHGPIYREMIDNLMTPILKNNNLNLLRYHIVHALPSATTDSVIGRAAHIAVVDSDVFLEQFFLVTALQYFV